jgi:hypothetical protein
MVREEGGNPNRDAEEKSANRISRGRISNCRLQLGAQPRAAPKLLVNDTTKILVFKGLSFYYQL